MRTARSCEGHVTGHVTGDETNHVTHEQCIENTSVYCVCTLYMYMYMYMYREGTEGIQVQE